MLKPFPFISTLGEVKDVLDEVVQTLAEQFAGLKRTVTNDFVVTATLGTDDVRVYHGLKEPPATWEVVGLNAGEVVYESSTTNTNRKLYLFLKATGPVTAKIRFAT